MGATTVTPLDNNDIQKTAIDTIAPVFSSLTSSICEPMPPQPPAPPAPLPPPPQYLSSTENGLQNWLNCDGKLYHWVFHYSLHETAFISPTPSAPLTRPVAGGCGEDLNDINLHSLIEFVFDI